MNFQLKSLGTKTVGIILFSAILASCGTKRNMPLVTKNEVANSSSSNVSTSSNEASSSEKTRTGSTLKVEATADSPLLESIYVDSEAAPNLTAGNEDFSSITIKSSEIVEDGKTNETQYITLEHRFEGVGPSNFTIMSARHALAGTESGTHVFANRYLPFGKYDVENNFFGIEVKNEAEFNALKYSLIYKDELSSGAALITTSTVNEFKFNPDDKEATKLSIPQTKVRFLRLNAKKIKKFTYAKAKEKSECAFGSQYPSSVVVNLFDLGDVSDFYVAADKSMNVDFSNKETLFTSELSKTPTIKTQDLAKLPAKPVAGVTQECPAEAPSAEGFKIPMQIKVVPYEPKKEVPTTENTESSDNLEGCQ